MAEQQTTGTKMVDASEAETLLAEATTALSDIRVRDKAFEFFRSKPEIKDPWAVANNLMQSGTLRGSEASEDLSAKLEAWVEQQRAIWVGSQSEPPGDDDNPVGAAEQPLEFVPRGPNPGANGSTASPEPLTWDSPEVRALRDKGDEATLSRWVDEGKLKLSASNPYANTGRSTR